MAGIDPECTTSIPLASTTAAGWPASTASAGDLAAVERLRPEWEALLGRTRCNRVFCSPSWFLAGCRGDSSLRPFVVTVRRGGELAALLPLVFDGDGLRFATHLADYNDLLALDADAALAALDHALCEPLPLSLKRTRDDGWIYAAARTLGLPMEPDREMSYIDLRDGYAAFLSTRSRSFRANIRQARRRAAAAGCQAVELTPETFAPEALPPVFLAIHLSRIPYSVLDEPEYVAFVNEAFPVLFAERKLRVFAMLHGTRVGAIDLCTTGNGSLGLWNGGFDPVFAGMSPGRLILDFSARLLCAEGIPEYDLLRGDYPYKHHWRTGVRVTWTFRRD